MSKGFTLMEMVITIIVLSVLSAFTFSVIWQYSKLYADTRGGYVYGEAAAVLERMSRELRDATAVDTLGSPPYINFLLTHGTPANSNNPTWVQYCTCSSAGKTILYRVQNTSQGAANLCQSACPPAAGANTSLMSRNMMSSGFQVSYFAGTPSPEGDSYEITLKLASGGSSNTTIALVTRVSPRNFPPATPGHGRSFDGGYKDERN
jgi:prepilin-type N-terminal cleavage/methylation domain-containing protein